MGWVRLALRPIPYTTDPFLGLARLSRVSHWPPRGNLIELHSLVANRVSNGCANEGYPIPLSPKESPNTFI